MKKYLAAAVLLPAALAFGQGLGPGSKVRDFSLTDRKGNPAPFSSLRGETTVVVFLSTRCPVSNAYNQRMDAVYSDYSARGVKFVFVNANFNETAAEVEDHRQSHSLSFPVYKDSGGEAAELFGATVTPETYVIAGDGTVRYHGYIDDSQNPARIRNQGLRKALDAVLAGQAVPVAETKAFGCTIKKPKRTS